MIVLVLGGVAACGGGKGGTGGGSDAPAADGTLLVSPDTATVMLAPQTANGTDFTGTQNFTVTLKAADGTTTDVTAMAQLLNDDAHLSLTAGALTVNAAGHYMVSFTYGASIANAQVTAVLNGKLVDGSLPSGSDGMLDGTPESSTHPAIEYPLDGSLFPVNIAPVEIHIQKSSAAQTIARVELTSGTMLEYLYYAPCQASPDKTGTFQNTCIVALTGAFGQQLAGVSEADDVTIKIRLAGPAGQNLVESAPIKAAWSKVALTGGLYYWTTAPASNAPNAATTEFARYNFDGDASRPQQYLLDTAAPKVTGAPQCVGCHSLSPDGTKLSFSLGGSSGAFFSVFDAASKAPATPSEIANRFAGMSTFSHDGSRVVTMIDGVLTLRSTANLEAPIQSNLLSSDVPGEKLSHPFWSQSGKRFAFVSWIPSQVDVSAGHNTGDMVQGGQIWVAKSDGQTITMPTKIVARADNTTSYYPAISDDDQLVVFNQSSCAGPANNPAINTWGLGACDGYQDPSASLHIVPVTGGAAIALDKANGGVANVTNSWPRWSPDHGEFRGKRLYWIAFSSRRAYGRALPSPYSFTSGTHSADSTKPQLWFAALAIPDDGTMPTTDPSFAPVWLPGQNTLLDQNGQVDPSSSQADPRGNHTPVWTSKAVGPVVQ
jgi:hypothetical protein